MELKEIIVDKNWPSAPAWVVEVKFEKEIRRSLDMIDGKPIDNDSMVLQAIVKLVNLHIEWIAGGRG